MIRTDHPEALYVHVPFCRSICAYCDFTHEPYRIERADAWLKALKQELSARVQSASLKTIYLGGGTPTALSLTQLEALLSMLDPYAEEAEEYTIEVNPETLDEAKAECLARHRINRASIGYQSDNPKLLALMNRHHSYEDTAACMELLRRHGIANLSLDLMYSLPGQTMAQLQQAVYHAMDLKPAHLSLYSLTIEQGTAFAARKLNHLDDDAEADMYEWICRTLPEHGYQQYEISNFALRGYESRHNLMYWNYRDFYGISAGASGKEGLLRYDHGTLKEYLEDPLAVKKILLSEADARFEMVMMSLRLVRGLDRKLFQETFGIDVNEVYGSVISRLLQKGWLKEEERYLACTKKSYEILNTVLEEFLPEE